MTYDQRPPNPDDPVEPVEPAGTADRLKSAKARARIQGGRS